MIVEPDAIADTATTLKGVVTTINVLSNDVSPLGYALTVTSASGASHGTTKVNANGTARTMSVSVTAENAVPWGSRI